jgi:VWFA-related protein
MIYKTIGLLLAIIFSANITAISAMLGGQSQTKPAGQNETVRLRTELVQVQVVVTDKQGRVIEELKKEDFELLEQGRPQEVSFFSEERVGAQPNRQATPNTDQVAERPTGAPGSAKQLRSIVLFFDTLHLSGPSLIRARLSVKQFVDERMTDQDTVVVATSSGVFGVFQNPSQNRQPLLRLIERISNFDASGQSNFTPYLSAMVKQGDRAAYEVAAQVFITEELGGVSLGPGIEPMVRAKASEVLEIASYKRQSTLSVLSAVAERVMGMPGQRLLILMSDGFSMRNHYGVPDTGDVQSAISKAVRSGVIIYSIDVKGLEVAAEFDASRRGVTGGSKIIGRFSSYMSASAKDRQDGINALAQDTGGKAFFNTNDLKGALQKAIDLNRIYYTLAYYPPDDKGAKEFRRITVRVKSHPEYNVRAQKGYFASDLKKAEEKELAQSSQQRLLNAIAKPLPVADIGVIASADYLEVGTDGEQVSLQALIDGTKLTYREQNGRLLIELDLAAVVYDRTGKPVNTVTETIRGALSVAEAEAAKRTGFHYSKRIALKPGLYNIRLGLREAGTDRVGTAATWLEVPNLGQGKLTLSSILLTKDSVETAIPRGPAGGAGTSATLGVAYYKTGSPVLYDLMIYNARGESDLTMQWEIAEAGKVIHRTEWQPVASRLIGRDKKGIEIGGQLKLTLQPGLYELRISVTDSKSKQTAQRTVAFAIDS